MATTEPINADGTYNEPTWGESTSYTVSAYEASGIPAGAVVGLNDFNQPRQHMTRCIRAIRDRSFPTDQGLMTNCVIRAGTWNTEAGTLDGTVTITRFIIDADSDGGVQVEFVLSAGSPHTFTASKDTYINLDEDGAVEYQEVANGAGAPSPSAGYVAVWKVVTDGTELTAATVIVTALPTFRDIAALSVGTAELNTSGDVNVGGQLDVTGAVEIGGNVTMGDGPGDSHTVNGGITCTSTLAVQGNTTLGNEITDTTTIAGPATLNSTLEVNGNVSLGNGGVDTLTVNAIGTFSNTTTFNAATTVSATNTFSSLGDSVVGTDSGDALTVNATATLESASTVNALMTFIAAGVASGGVTSDATAILSWLGLASFSGRVSILGTAPAGAGELAQDGSSNLQWRDASATKYVLVNASGWVKGHGQADTVAAGSPVTLDTDAAVAPIVSVDLDVEASFWIQRAVGAGVVTVSLIEVGVGQIGTSTDINVTAIAGSTNYNVITFSRTKASASTTPKVFRLSVDGGGQNVNLKNARISVTPTS